MTRFGQTPKTHLGTVSFSEGGCAVVAAVQLVLLLAFILCSGASAQNEHGADYIRNSQPPLLTYQELVTLGEQETVDPALAAKLHTLLTTPFVNNEAYFNGIKPMRPDLKGMGPSLRLVEWNIERGIEFDKIKLSLTDKQGFIAEVHSEAASNTNTDKGRRPGATRPDGRASVGRRAGIERGRLGHEEKRLPGRGQGSCRCTQDELGLWCRVCRSRSQDLRYPIVRECGESRRAKGVGRPVSASIRRAFWAAWHRHSFSLSSSGCEARALSVSGLRLVQRREEVWVRRSR